MVTHSALDIDIRDEIEVRTDIDSQTAHRVIDLRETPGIQLDDDADLVLRPYRTARRLSSDAEILAARRLNAEVYLASGFISITDIGADGTIDSSLDGWSSASDYFAVMRDGSAVATARQITSGEPDRLPALSLADLAASEVQMIRDLPAGSAVEISGLARSSDTPSSDVVAVYVRMWRESLLRRHRVWVMGVDVRVFELLRALLCGAAIRRIGPDQEYLGSKVVPAVIWCDELSSEQRRLADLASSPTSLQALLPRLFPHPSGVSL